MGIQLSCKSCNERTVGCHGKCFRYIFYRVRLRQEKQKRSDYWHDLGYDPIEKERRQKIKAIKQKKDRKRG